MTLFIVAAVTAPGDRAYGYFKSPAREQGIAVADLQSGGVTRLTAFPSDSSGLLSLAVDPPWMAWVRGDSQSVIGAWTVHARNLDTGEQLTLATSRLDDGSHVFGQLPLAGHAQAGGDLGAARLEKGARHRRGPRV